MPTGAAPALARVEWLAIELDPETLRMLRVGEAEDHIVHVVPAYSRVPRRERELVTEREHFGVTGRHYIGADGNPVRPLAGEPRTGYFIASGNHRGSALAQRLEIADRQCIEYL
jgi:hypothetical protein